MTWTGDPQVPEKVIDAAGKVEMIVMDVDGVLTDGKTYTLPDGERFVGFNVQDSLALVLAHAAGIKLAVISGRDLKAARFHLEQFPLAEMHFGVAHKKALLLEIAGKYGLAPENLAYLADDLADLPALSLVGLPVAVANAVPEVREAALYRTARSGGDGAVREVVALILKARGLYQKALDDYLREK